MNLDQARQEVEQLRQQINHHNHLYYVNAQQEISDLEFDRLLSKLIERERDFPELQSLDSPSQKVGGAPIDGFRTVPHRVAMLSIDNVYELQGIRDFDQRIRKLLELETVDYTLEYKIDGVALAAIYEKGKLNLALTRGDGQSGDDITHNARTVGGLPLILEGDYPSTLEVRGEAYIANSQFSLLQAEQERRGETVFANPRNSTAGALKLLDPKQCAQRKVRFVAHGIGYAENFASQTHMQYIERLREFGIPTTPEIRICKGIDDVLKQVEQMLDQLHILDLEIDGLVIKVNDQSQQKELGTTSKSPRWVIAYKWERYEETTQVNQIDIQVGKTGTLTPVANLKPVEIAGTIVSRSSLHNRDEMQRLGIKVGDWVVVEKAGKIIPHVLRVILERRDGSEQDFHYPTHCPVCGTLAQQDEGGIYIRCPNLECPARLRETLRFFASRKAMDVEGLGTKLVEQLVDLGLVKNLADLYQLHKMRDELLAMERMGMKSVDKLLLGIENSKTKPLWRLLTGLNIRHVGTNSARVLASHYRDLEQLQQQSAETLASINEIGPVIAESVHEFLNSSYGRNILEQLTAAGVKPESSLATENEPEQPESPISGKTLVVTGALTQMTRVEMQDLIRLHGGKASGSISKNTDFLVIGENAGSKLAKAKELGVTILSESDFHELLASS